MPASKPLSRKTSIYTSIPENERICIKYFSNYTSPSSNCTLNVFNTAKPICNVSISPSQKTGLRGDCYWKWSECVRTFPDVKCLGNILGSVVTVSKILLSVGFGRFCKKNRGFRFGFYLSRFPPVVNVVRLCGPLHIKPAAVRYIFLCITPVDTSKYPTACDWWRENHHLYPMSHVLRNATCLAVCATDIRC